MKMALEVEYMMEYQHPGLPVTDLHLRSSTDRSVCVQDKSKTYGRILMKFSGYV